VLVAAPAWLARALINAGGLMRNPLGTQAEIANLDRAAMTFYLAGASLMLALVELAHVKPVEFADPTRDLLYCLAYGFAPAAAGYAMAIINRLAGRGRTRGDFMDDRNWGWMIFLLILAAGQMLRAATS